MSSSEPHNPIPDFAAPAPSVPETAAQPEVQPFQAPPTSATSEQPWAEPAPDPAAPVAEPAAERVGRGLLFSLGAIVVGVALTLLLWQLGFIASITSFALAYAAIWLYTRGAGTPPAKGALGLVGVIVVGVALSLVSIVAADALTYLGQEYPDASITEKVVFVTDNLVRAEVWQAYTTDALMYVLFAALGTFGLIRQLGRAKGA